MVAERWEAGCHNIAQLHRELVASGHTLTYRNVYRQLVRYLPEGRKKSASDSQLPRSTVLARDAVFLFLRRPEKLEAEDQETLMELRSLHAEVDQTYELIQQFTQMLRTRTGEQLDSWLEPRASQSDPRVAGLCGWSGTRQSSGGRRTHTSTKQWCGRRESQ